MSEIDPFAASASRPSVSFKNATPGTSYTGIVTELPSIHQQTDYVTKKPKSYDDGNPMMTVCVPVNISGEDKSFWADKEGKDGGGMFSAIAKAQEAAGARLAVGGTLTVTFLGMGMSKATNAMDKKLFSATYVPPNAFAQEAPAAVPAPPVVVPAPVAAVPPPPVSGPTFDQLVAAGWAPEQIAASYPHLSSAPVAAVPPPPGVPAPPAADAQAAAVAALTPEQRAALGL